ncbi:MAG: DUF4238 domain-containing protein [Acidobacteriia bacterium]|nr:DUF4238 domain-containing protein [Terriglobia bacterium]
MTPTHRNRRDHYIPQGYLRGFIGPGNELAQKPLWVFDIPQQAWSQKSTREFAYRYGLYDYSEESPSDTIAADVSFAGLEQHFPQVRDEISSDGFINWAIHKNFLFRFMDMMRVRSLLALDQMRQIAGAKRILEIEKVLEPSPDSSNRHRKPDTVKYKERIFKDESEKQRLLKNLTLTEMRRALERPAPWLSSLSWALRYTTDSSQPFVCSEHPLLVYGNETAVSSALASPDTLIFFPVSWRACLVGCLARFEKETCEFHPEEVERVRTIYRESATLFIASPCKTVF